MIRSGEYRECKEEKRYDILQYTILDQSIINELASKLMIFRAEVVHAPYRIE